jgi:glycosidase
VVLMRPNTVPSRALLALAAAALAGCVGPGRLTRLESPTGAALAVVLEAEGRGAALATPPEVAATLAGALEVRNLSPVTIDAAVLAPAFARKRSTPDRLALVQAQAQAAPVLVVVEARASFYAQIEGRYRWTIRARLSVARAAALAEVQSEDVELPVVLRFDHQREADALIEAAPMLSRALAPLLDRFLAGLPGAASAEATGTSTRAGVPPADALYFVLVDRFENGDPTNDGAVDRADPQGWHGGDLAGVRARLDHLAALGVTDVWLSPVFDARDEKFHGWGAFHGYWTHDLGAVEPRFGTEAELVALADDLRARGMRLHLDLVVNHVAWDAPLRAQHPDWFHERGPIRDWHDPVQLETHDVHGLPDLALEREEVHAWAAGHALRWLERVRPAGYRLDAVRHVPAATWRRLAAELHAAGGPGFALLGEVFDGAPQALARTFEDGFDRLFDFPLGFAVVEAVCGGAPAGKVAAIFSQDRLYPDPTRLVTLLDNHDLPRLASRCGGDLERAKQALTVQFTSRGTPSITYGTEAALAGAEEPANRADMRFDALPLAGTIRALLAARRETPALRARTTRILAADRGFAAWARIAGEDAVIVALNTGDEPREVSFGGATLAVPARSTRTRAVRGAFAELERPLAAREVEVAAEGAPSRGELVLVGGGPELGGWDPARAPRLDPAGRVRLALPAPGAYGVKLALRAPDGTVTWQEGSDRILFVPEGEGADRWTIAWQGEQAWRRSL